jgi:hypothetical protein
MNLNPLEKLWPVEHSDGNWRVSDSIRGDKSHVSSREKNGDSRRHESPSCAVDKGDGGHASDCHRPF